MIVTTEIGSWYRDVPKRWGFVMVRGTEIEPVSVILITERPGERKFKIPKLVFIN